MIKHVIYLNFNYFELENCKYLNFRINLEFINCFIIFKLMSLVLKKILKNNSVQIQRINVLIKRKLLI